MTGTFVSCKLTPTPGQQPAGHIYNQTDSGTSWPAHHGGSQEKKDISMCRNSLCDLGHNWRSNSWPGGEESHSVPVKIKVWLTINQVRPPSHLPAHICPLISTQQSAGSDLVLHGTDWGSRLMSKVMIKHRQKTRNQSFKLLSVAITFVFLM